MSPGGADDRMTHLFPATTTRREGDPRGLPVRQTGPVLPIAADHLEAVAMASPGWADLYGWQLDRASRTPLTRQIYMQVRAAVLSGALRPGTRVPSSRMLAGKLGVARASVVAAYEHLLAEGYVESRAGSGTFISADLTSLGARPRSPSRMATRPVTIPVLADFERAATQGEARPFNTGRTLIDARTAETWRRLTHRAARSL